MVGPLPSSAPPAAGVHTGVTLRGVAVKAGSATLLRDIHLTLKPGALCALIGPSGAGKSTLIKVLLGMREPAAGVVRLNGKPVGEAAVVGYVPQDDALHGVLTVERALFYAAQLRLPQHTAAQHSARVEEVLRQVGLVDRRALRIDRLSGGQRKRVSVALELLTSPPLLILDEPTSGLDPGMEAHMMALFAQLARDGRVLLVATHAMESLAVCQQLVVLVEGCLAYAGPPQAAPGYFGVDRHAAIFTALKAKKGPAWAQQWERQRPRVTEAA